MTSNSRDLQPPEGLFDQEADTTDNMHLFLDETDLDELDSNDLALAGGNQPNPTPQNDPDSNEDSDSEDSDDDSDPGTYACPSSSDDGNLFVATK